MDRKSLPGRCSLADLGGLLVEPAIVVVEQREHTWAQTAHRENTENSIVQTEVHGKK